MIEKMKIIVTENGDIYRVKNELAFEVYNFTNSKDSERRNDEVYLHRKVIDEGR